MNSGINHTGNWDSHQFAIDMGWDHHCIEATARLGVSEADAAGLTPWQQDELLAWCREQVAR